MSDEIKDGDLVRVEYPTPCCGKRWNIGYTFYVSKIHILRSTSERFFYCDNCSYIFGALHVAQEVGSNYGQDIRRLKRIDPPAMDDEVETQRELTV